MTALTGILIGLAILGFFWGIVVAGKHTRRGNAAAMPPFLAQVTTTVAGVLAINLGAVIGLSAVPPTQTDAVRALSPETWLGATSVSAATQIQIAGAWFYVTGLILAVVVWGLNKFREGPHVVVPLLPDLSRSLLAAILGALAVTLGVGSR